MSTEKAVSSVKDYLAKYGVTLNEFSNEDLDALMLAIRAEQARRRKVKVAKNGGGK